MNMTPSAFSLWSNTNQLHPSANLQICTNLAPQTYVHRHLPAPLSACQELPAPMLLPQCQGLSRSQGGSLREGRSKTVVLRCSANVIGYNRDCKETNRKCPIVITVIVPSLLRTSLHPCLLAQRSPSPDHPPQWQRCLPGGSPPGSPLPPCKSGEREGAGNAKGLGKKNLPNGSHYERLV